MPPSLSFQTIESLSPILIVCLHWTGANPDQGTHLRIHAGATKTTTFDDHEWKNTLIIILQHEEFRNLSHFLQQIASTVSAPFLCPHHYSDCVLNNEISPQFILSCPQYRHHAEPSLTFAGIWRLLSIGSGVPKLYHSANLNINSNESKNTHGTTIAYSTQLQIHLLDKWREGRHSQQ